MNLGRAIRLVRQQRNMSQGELAASTGLSTSYVSLLERGKRDPVFGVVEKIAKALKVPTSILIFLAASDADLEHLGPDLAQSLSYAALSLIRESSESASLPA